jgi:hypothetical protein
VAENTGFTVLMEKKHDSKVVFENSQLNNRIPQTDSSCTWAVEPCAVEKEADCFFVSQLVDLIEDGLKLAMDNTLISVYNCPLHGKCYVYFVGFHYVGFHYMAFTFYYREDARPVLR